MSKHDIYEVGLKLLGVYFIASSIHSAGLFVIQIVQQIPVFSTGGVPRGFFTAILFGLLHPGLQIAAGIFLIKKARWIISKLDQ